jgi:branched-chain amino acid transport system permease protein
MVYGIIELINFAHGDLFMLGSFFALTLIGWLGLAAAGTGATVLGIAFLYNLFGTGMRGISIDIEEAAGEEA